MKKVQFEFTEAELRAIHMALGNERALFGKDTRALQEKVREYIRQAAEANET
jgi:hypothetical protein